MALTRLRIPTTAFLETIKMKKRKIFFNFLGISLFATFICYYLFFFNTFDEPNYFKNYTKVSCFILWVLLNWDGAALVGSGASPNVVIRGNQESGVLDGIHG